MPFGEIILLSTMAISASAATIFSFCNLDVVCGTSSARRSKSIKMGAGGNDAAKAA